MSLDYLQTLDVHEREINDELLRRATAVALYGSEAQYSAWLVLVRLERVWRAETGCAVAT